jgi:SAM-dependent methyltransferase
MTDVTCALCQSNDYVVVFEAGVAQTNRIVRCKRCSLLYANPRSREPDVDEIVRYDADFVLENLTKRESQRLDKEALQVRDYDETRRYLAHRHPARGRLLEIGSGMGYLLNYFRSDGWTTLGIEPNVGFSRYAQQKFKLDVKPTVLHEAALPAASIDAALMMHVIEHVPDPMAIFREVYRVLKPGGTFVVETPRYDTLTFKLLGRRERSVSCGGHIYFFTSKTLTDMATKAGFRVDRLDFVGRSLTLERLLFNVGIVSKSRAVQGALDRLSRSLGLNRISMTVNLRDMQRAYLHKAAA